MIVARTEALQALLDARKWGEMHLAAEMGCVLNTANALLAGAGVSGNTVARVLAVFPDAAFTDLFEVVRSRKTSEFINAMDEQGAVDNAAGG